MRLFILCIALLIITSCQSMHSNDPNSLFFSIPAGSTLSLGKELSISSTETHGTIQAGKQIADDDRQFYDISCRLDFEKFGPRTIEPEKFTVTRTEDGQNWISQPSILRFYTEVYLKSNKDTDIIKMVCQFYGDTIDRNFTVAEMQEALGDFVTIEYATTK
ncbi:MAG: hypothetical protein DRQ44_07540 [Gammaproteobacteria bacterium]|nr:MAG: hypothetical protein DRQ44_07540 [Gammaproteobacteria bacterium]